MNISRVSDFDRAKVDAIIFDHISNRLQQAGEMDPGYRYLWQEIQTLMSAGGKRVRSRIALLTYQMFGGKDVAAILPIAAAHELLHLGMLIHDDIIDRDYIRYGVKNIAGNYDNLYASSVEDGDDRRHYAHSAAILAGDLLLSDTYQLILAADIEPVKIIEVQKIFGNGIFEVIGGELLDTEASFIREGAVGPEKIALHKTASYTFTLPMLVGACLADVSMEQKRVIEEFSENLGIAFQLRDDVLGVFGDQDETGKTNSGDIREGKRTYMIERFFELADDQQREEFETVFGYSDIREDQVERARQLLIESGARDRTEEAIRDYTQKSRSLIGALGIEPEFLDDLDELIVLVTERTK